MGDPQRVRLVLGGVLLLAVCTPSRGDVCQGISPVSGSPVTTVRVASGLEFPTLAVSPGGDVERLFIVEQPGRVRIFTDGSLLATPFLDITAITRSVVNGGGNEEGLLSLAFHPDYAANGWLFVFHTALNGQSNKVARYTRSSANPDRVDPLSRQVVLTIPHPDYTNHNGGMIAFGPQDGHLYIGTGDGGFRCDPAGNGQDLTSLLGKMLRINVDSLPYTIPAGNPFAGTGGSLPEIWAFGLRNPWRWSFDANGDLYIADVGQDQWEEINYQSAAASGGENYGWDRYEADDCPAFQCSAGNCNLPGHVGPVHKYDHTAGCSVTGGPVYRGCRLPDLHGTYFYADFCAAFVRSFRMVAGFPTEFLDWTGSLQPSAELAIAEITAFGSDGRGEVYVLDRGTATPDTGGELFMIVPVISAMEVSGIGAAPLQLTQAGGSAWSWENLAETAPHSIANYRVYRADAPSGELFSCIHQQPETTWSSFDPTEPAAGEVLAYLVTAIDDMGNETGPGAGTTGTPRLLSAAACP